MTGFFSRTITCKDFKPLLRPCTAPRSDLITCFTNLGAELVELSVLVAGDDVLPQRPPHGAGYLVVAAWNRQVGLVVFCRDTKGGKKNLSLELAENTYLC